MSVKRVPQIRFKRFEDDWEECKFSEVYEKINEKNDLSFGVEKIISVANMYYKKDINVNSTDEYMKTYNIFRMGDIAFEGNKSKDYSYGRFVENYIGDGIVSHVFDVFRPIVNYDLWFWKYKINNENIMGHVLRRVTTKATMMNNLVSKDFLKATVFVPNINEQKKIGNLMSNIDNLITLHQRKLELLKDTKKSMLQKMFPKEGATVPEIRFKGFTGDWEERKLGEVTSKIGSGKTPKGGASAYKDEGIYLIRSQNINFDRVDLFDVVYIDNKTDEDMRNSRVVYGDILLNITGASIGRCAVFRSNVNANVNQHVCIIRPKNKNYSPEFIQLNLISDKGEKQIDSYQAGGAREGLNFEQIGKMSFYFPNVVEQDRIGEYFKNIDMLIKFNQRKLNSLKTLKKSMLQKMFI